MAEDTKNSKQPRKQLVFAITIVAAVAFALLLALVMRAASSPRARSIDRDSYADDLAAALDGADAKIGEALISETDCATCHLTGDGRSAPLFDGIASVAEQRRPPLSAAQYLYEAIIFPAAHLVNGYANAMPNNYGERLPPTDLGHMIAYLLTLADENEDR